MQAELTCAAHGDARCNSGHKHRRCDDDGNGDDDVAASFAHDILGGSSGNTHDRDTADAGDGSGDVCASQSAVRRRLDTTTTTALPRDGDDNNNGNGDSSGNTATATTRCASAATSAPATPPPIPLPRKTPMTPTTTTTTTTTAATLTTQPCRVHTRPSTLLVASASSTTTLLAACTDDAATATATAAASPTPSTQALSSTSASSSQASSPPLTPAPSSPCIATTTATTTTTMTTTAAASAVANAHCRTLQPQPHVHAQQHQQHDGHGAIEHKMSRRAHNWTTLLCRAMMHGRRADEQAHVRAVCARVVAALRGDDAQAVKDAFVMLLVNVKDEENDELRRRIVDGELPVEVLVTLGERELANPRRRRALDEAFEQRAKDRNLTELRKATQTTSTLFACPACRVRDCTWTQRQTRSGDEPMTVFCTCNKCGHVWKRY